MATDKDQALHDFVSGRYRHLRRCAFLMSGDWALADELTRATLAKYVAASARAAVDDPDTYVYAGVMSAFHHRPAKREHVFVATEATDEPGADPIRMILVLDALHKLSPRCRAVLILRHWEGFTPDEVADILDLPDVRVKAYEAAGQAALNNLQPSPEPSPRPEAVPA